MTAKMAKSGIETIYRLTKNFKKGELETLRLYLQGFYNTGVSYQPQTLKLLEQVIKGGANPDEKKIAAKFRLKPTDNTFIKLCSRLRIKIYESLLLDINMNREGSYEKLSKEENDIRKKIILSELLVTRNCLPEANQVLSKTIESCNRYEFYDYLCSALFWKFKMDIRFMNHSKVAVTETDLKNAQYHRDLSNKAETYFYKAGFIHQKKGQREFLTDEIQEFIFDLEQQPEVQKNGHAMYYLYNLRLELSNYNDDYEQLYRWSRELITLIDAKDGLKKKIKYANAYGYRMVAALKTKQFSDASEYIELSKQLVTPGTLNYLNLQEYEFYALFFDHRHEEAQQLIDQMIQQAAKKSSHFHKNKFMYLKACNLMKMKQYAEANKTMMGIHELENDKDGWNIGIRLFNIMNRLEKKLYDVADSQIENMRKYFEHTMKHTALRKRDVTILRILLKLEQNNYDYETAYKKSEKLFALLDLDMKDYRWKMLSHELIPFQDWFREMLELQKKQESRRSEELVLVPVIRKS